MFTVRFLSARVERELFPLPSQDRARVVLRLRQLEQEPRPTGAVSLATGVYRVRVGQYRIIYSVNDAAEAITILRISRRNERTYRGLQELL